MDYLDSDVGHFPATPPAIPRNKKIINDPIHGHILLDPYIVAAIDTPQFQRLRDLKQLGTLYYVFPGASHNRFEHCIGVSHLAGRLMDRFQSTQPELEISPREVELVKLAGLCHDLGHGPFSHAFEGWMHKTSKEEWHHEHMSVRMLNFMVEENALEYDRSEIKFVSDLITGHRPTDPSRSFLYEIVANGRNSIDVDKFDYLSRDCYNLGIKSSYDSSRLMNHSRVINGEICFHAKEAYNLYEMFHTRYSLHKQVYQHRVNKCIEFMVSDALAEADSVMKISEAAHDPAQYLYLTDSILLEIARRKDAELAASRNIIRRIRTRELYKFVDEAIIPPLQWDSFPKQVTEESLLKEVNSYGLKPQDIIIQNLSFNYAMKNRNPVDHVHFFTRWNDAESFLIPRQQVSLLVPQQFEEKVIRIFVRNPDHLGSAQSCFRDFLRLHGCTSSLSRGHELTSPPSPRRTAAGSSRTNSVSSIISSTPPASVKEQVTPSRQHSNTHLSPESAAVPKARNVKRKLEDKKV